MNEAKTELPTGHGFTAARGSEAVDYYILSMKHSPADGCAIWWRPKCAGYTTNLLEAGRYTEAQVTGEPEYYNDGTCTRAVKCAAVEAAIRLTVDWNIIRKQLMPPNASSSATVD
jgi:hypothetical protein